MVELVEQYKLYYFKKALLCLVYHSINSPLTDTPRQSNMAMDISKLFVGNQGNPL